jgi:hypothetical protein
MTNGTTIMREETAMRSRPTKFTPERMDQIKNLVERGRSREEIAETIGCTVGTLAVTCSKFGISLRQPRFGVGLRSACLQPPRLLRASPEPPSVERPAAAPDSPVERHRDKPPALVLRMEYRGQQRTTELPLTHEMIGTLAIEAEIRGMHISEMIAALLVEIVNKDLFDLVRNRGASIA